MSSHAADLIWQRDGGDFLAKRYSRRHTLRFDGGLELPASASPAIVPEPLSDPRALDPEEAFVAALASCHCLWFLSIAADRGHCVDRYEDRATGTVAPDGGGRLAMTEVTLHPRVTFSGTTLPTAEHIREMHHAAHEHCFIANSVKTRVRCEPVIDADE